jgi:hypothetical protein
VESLFRGDSGPLELRLTLNDPAALVGPPPDGSAGPSLSYVSNTLSYMAMLAQLNPKGAAKEAADLASAGRGTVARVSSEGFGWSLNIVDTPYGFADVILDDEWVAQPKGIRMPSGRDPHRVWVPGLGPVVSVSPKFGRKPTADYVARRGDVFLSDVQDRQFQTETENSLNFLKSVPGVGGITSAGDAYWFSDRDPKRAMREAELGVFHAGVDVACFALPVAGAIRPVRAAAAEATESGVIARTASSGIPARGVGERLATTDAEIFLPDSIVTRSSMRSGVPDTPGMHRLPDGVVFRSKDGNVFSDLTEFLQNERDLRNLVPVVEGVRNTDMIKGVLTESGYRVNPTSRRPLDNISQPGTGIRPPGRAYNPHTGKLEEGEYMFVVDRDGNLIIGNRIGFINGVEYDFPHPSLIGGSNPLVEAAGKVWFRKGQVVRIDNASGHFRPGVETLDNAEAAFSRLPRSVYDPNKVMITDFTGKPVTRP